MGEGVGKRGEGGWVGLSLWEVSGSGDGYASEHRCHSASCRC